MNAFRTRQKLHGRVTLYKETRHLCCWSQRRGRGTHPSWALAGGPKTEEVCTEEVCVCVCVGVGAHLCIHAQMGVHVCMCVCMHMGILELNYLSYKA
jgi:hypothetical protein